VATLHTGPKDAEAILRFGLSQLLKDLAADPMPSGGNMKPSTTDQIEGKFHEVKGKAKEKVGHVTDNPKLAAEGHVERVAGVVQKKVGQIEKVLEK
jgi:uncharacterized protein YjbJ (UPF0337 family)